MKILFILYILILFFSCSLDEKKKRNLNNNPNVIDSALIIENKHEQKQENSLILDNLITKMEEIVISNISKTSRSSTYSPSTIKDSSNQKTICGGSYLFINYEEKNRTLLSAEVRVDKIKNDDHKIISFTTCTYDFYPIKFGMNIEDFKNLSLEIVYFKDGIYEINSSNRKYIIILIFENEKLSAISFLNKQYSNLKSKIHEITPINCPNR
jgi:hypothetical protein